jgi:hypothetical protein
MKRYENVLDFTNGLFKRLERQLGDINALFYAHTWTVNFRDPCWQRMSPLPNVFGKQMRRILCK